MLILCFVFVVVDGVSGVNVDVHGVGNIVFGGGIAAVYDVVSRHDFDAVCVVGVDGVVIKATRDSDEVFLFFTRLDIQNYALKSCHLAFSVYIPSLGGLGSNP